MNEQESQVATFNELAQLQQNDEESNKPPDIGTNKQASGKVVSSQENIVYQQKTYVVINDTNSNQILQDTTTHMNLQKSDQFILDFEVFHHHKFQLIERVKEAKISHIKWTLHWRIGFVCCLLGLLWWVVCLIAAAGNHKKIPFCDVTASLFYSCSGLNKRNVANLCYTYCTDEPCWKKLDDTDIDITYITANGVVVGSTVNGSCADYNNESTAMFYCRIFFLITVLLWCWKLFKQIWKGIELPSLETAQITGCKKILKMPERVSDKFYDLRINVRFLVEKVHRNKDFNNHEHFIKLMWDSFLLLFGMQFFLLDLPFQILNLCSTSTLLRVTGGMEMAFEVFWFLVFIREWKNWKIDTDHKLYKKLRKHYPKRNILSTGCYFTINKMWVAKVIMVSIPPLMMSYFALPVSNYDSWMRAITIFKHVFVMFVGCGKGFRLWIIVCNSFCAKGKVSKRESLLVKDVLKLFFVWAIFKIEIRDDDAFILVDEKRASAETMVFDDRYKDSPGKIWWIWCNLMTVAVFWGMACYFSLGNGAFELSAFQDVRF